MLTTLPYLNIQLLVIMLYLIFSIVRVHSSGNGQRYYAIDIGIAWSFIFFTIIYISFKLAEFGLVDSSALLYSLALIFPSFDIWNFSQAYKSEKVRSIKTIGFRYLALAIVTTKVFYDMLIA